MHGSGKTLLNALISVQQFPHHQISMPNSELIRLKFYTPCNTPRYCSFPIAPHNSKMKQLRPHLQVKKAYSSQDFTTCRELCFELLSSASLCNTLRVEILQVLSIIVPYSDAHGHLEDAMRIVEGEYALDMNEHYFGLRLTTIDMLMKLRREREVGDFEDNLCLEKKTFVSTILSASRIMSAARSGGGKRISHATKMDGAKVGGDNKLSEAHNSGVKPPERVTAR
jgi:hypothetical protein